MHFGNSAGNFGGSALRRPVGHDSAAAMSKLVALLPNCMQIVQNWSEKGVEAFIADCTALSQNRRYAFYCHHLAFSRGVADGRGGGPWGQDPRTFANRGDDPGPHKCGYFSKTYLFS